MPVKSLWFLKDAPLPGFEKKGTGYVFTKIILYKYFFHHPPEYTALLK
jgi:hypothetical protein